ncbi:hypothetical protein DFH09DRAFT_1115386 [Mycena vulgaris]|nr:hypothetical protein DFH09DRAFT_1115386 [Mycena vulgaris]
MDPLLLSGEVSSHLPSGTIINDAVVQSIGGSLPFDILFMVFWIVIRSIPVLPSGRLDLPAISKAKELLMGVCRQWYFALRNTPAFWSRLSIQRPISVRQIRELVARSGDLALGLHLSMVNTASTAVNYSPATVQGVFNSLSSAIPRSMFLHVRLDMPTMINHLYPALRTPVFTHLRTLSLINASWRDPLVHVPGRVGARPPPYPRLRMLSTFTKLQAMHLNYIPLDWSPRMDFQVLTVLVLVNATFPSYPTWNDYKIICARAPNLEKASFRRLGCTMIPNPGLTSPFQPLRHLHYLDVVFPNDITFAIVMAHMRLPALHSLALVVPTREHIVTLLEHGGRSFLRRVDTLYYSGDEDNDLSSLFLSLESLRFLSLRKNHSRVFDALTELSSSNTYPCVNLELLNVHSSPGPLWDFICLRHSGGSRSFDCQLCMGLAYA